MQASATPCYVKRIRTCSKDSECTWVRGSGCQDRDPGRYFLDGAWLTPEQQSVCRCWMHLLGSPSSRGKGDEYAYRVCAKGRTSTGGKPCMYDFTRIPTSEMKAYASLKMRQKRIKRMPLQNASKLRRALVAWYRSDKKKQSTNAAKNRTAAAA